MAADMPPEEFFREYVKILERVRDRSMADSTDLTDAMRLLGILHGASGELWSPFTSHERDDLTGHLVRTVVNGKLDNDAEREVTTTRNYLSWA
jgi:hypothetical protein